MERRCNQQISLITEGKKQLLTEGLGVPCSLWTRPTKLVYKHTNWSSKKRVRKSAYIHRVPVEAGTRAIPSKTQNLF